jgi:hypothetical protein
VFYQTGSSSTGDAQAKLGGVVGKVADLGVSGAAKYENAKSLGVLQKDLVQAIQNGNNCKLEVFKVLERDLIQNRQPSSNPIPFKNTRPSPKQEHFVSAGGINWNDFTKDVTRARNERLDRLYKYGTHPENFVANAEDPRRWNSFVGYLKMQLQRDSSSLEINNDRGRNKKPS